MTGFSAEDEQEMDARPSRWQSMETEGSIAPEAEEQERRVWALNEARKILIRNGGAFSGERLDAEEIVQTAVFILDGAEAVFERTATDPAVINGVIESIEIEVDRVFDREDFSRGATGIRALVLEAIRAARA